MAEPAHNRLVDGSSDVANVLQELAVLALAATSIRSAVTQ
jgi:hypothetical protein